MLVRAWYYAGAAYASSDTLRHELFQPFVDVRPS